MTTKQKQCLLAYLAQETKNDNLDPGGIDGIDGRRTKEAMNEFRLLYGCGEEGLVGAIAGTVSKVENVPDSSTDSNAGTFWDDIKYFSREEFRCTCKGRYCNGFPVEPDEKMVRALDAIREHFGVPITVSSGVRCKNRNAEVGGAGQSQHMYGTAADLYIPGVSPKDAYAYAESLLPGTGGIGIYNWGIHVDSRAVKARWDYR